MEDANLAMKQGSKLELVSHTRHSPLFHSFCKDVKIVIRGLRTRHPIFIVESGDHNLMLGQSFLNSIKFSKEYKLDGIFSTITYPHIHQTTVF